MKDKYKKTIIDLFGYGMGITTAICMLNILIQIKIYGMVRIGHSTGDVTLFFEIISISFSIPFFIYKLFKNILQR